MCHSLHSWLLSVLFSLFCAQPIFAQDEPATNSSVIVYDIPGAQEKFVFALNAVDNGDLYFHMSGPAENTWMAVGIGEEMAGALMFVVYVSQNGQTAVLSPRVAVDGESEPTYYPAVQCELHDANNSTTRRDSITANTTSGGSSNSLAVSAICHNATSWKGGSLDLNSTTQPWMFACGPKGQLNSNSTTADMVRHEFYGNFNLNMTMATSSNEGSIPRPNGTGVYLSKGTSSAVDTKTDGDKGPVIHAVIMRVAYIAVFPTGSLILRLAQRLKLHVYCQGLGLLLVIAGFGTGIILSGQYNRSRNHNSAHQVIGIIGTVVMIVQLAFGLVHHVAFERTQRPTILGKIHLFLGPAVIILGLINGGLGFDLAYASRKAIVAYAAVVIVVGVAFILARVLHKVLRKRYNKNGFTATEAEIANTAWPGPYDSEVPLTSYSTEDRRK